MKQTAKYKYLGNIVNEKCNLDDTINDKCNSGNEIIYEMVTLLKNPVLNANRIEVGIKIIETILIPKILYGCETWTNITKQQIDKLEKIQKDALQRIFTTSHVQRLVLGYILNAESFRSSTELSYENLCI